MRCWKKEIYRNESNFIGRREIIRKKGDIVNVSDGYARNAILPKKLGIEATSKNLNDLKLQNQHADKVAAENLENAKELAKTVEKQKVVVKIKAGEGGKILDRFLPKRSHRQQRSRPAWSWTRRRCICRMESKHSEHTKFR